MDKHKNPRIISVFGLGYVGLPVCASFGKKYRTIGFDVSSTRISELRTGHDRNGEIGEGELKSSLITYTDSLDDVRPATFHIVAVPTPVNEANQPDLSPLWNASRMVGKILKPGDIVVYESTVYPGVTEEECLPILDKESGLRSGIDYKVGYSPERMNPGDKEHSFSTLTKVVSGQDEESLAEIATLYASVVKEIHRAPSIKVAEAAKVIENTQRDLNIALMNELAIIFDRMGIDTQAVLEAASTKWNFVKFNPGLVGGHCIGVDPYYLTHKAEKLKYHPQVILAGRRINDGMGKFIAQKLIKEMIRCGQNVSQSTVSILGLTFKEDCSDLRNSRVVDIVRELQDYGTKIQLCDPRVDPKEAKRYYDAPIYPLSDMAPTDALVVAVAHKEFKALKPSELRAMLKSKPVLIDVKGIYSRRSMEQEGIHFWRL